MLAGRLAVLFRHPSIRRIAKQLTTAQKTTFEEPGIRFEEWINRILEIPEHLLPLHDLLGEVDDAPQELVLGATQLDPPRNYIYVIH